MKFIFRFMSPFLWLFFLVSLTAEAKVAKSSMCYYLNQPNEFLEGDRINERLDIASVSKVMVSHWAIYKWGPLKRFQSLVHIVPVEKINSKNIIYDVHISGQQDPFFGRDSMYFIYSELNRMGIENIRYFTFDENFKLYWNVVENPTEERPNIRTNDIIANLRRNLKMNPTAYSAFKKRAQAAGAEIQPNYKLTVRSFEFLKNTEFYEQHKTNPSLKIYKFASAPLYRYLKGMNLNSNNHVADQLFLKLGGPGAYHEFIKSRFDYDKNQILFYNGSGGDISIQGKTQYNEATCESVVNIILDLENLLKSQNLSLEDVIATSKADSNYRYSIHSTIQRYDNLGNGVITAKTGSINRAVTLGGKLATEKGDVFFMVFVSTDRRSDWGKGRNVIQNEILKLVNKHSGPAESSEYQPLPFTSIDQESKLELITKPALKQFYGLQ